MSAEEKEALKRGILELGFVDPIIARAEDYLVLGGHQRLDIFIEEEIAKVPTILVEGISDEHAALLNVLLNNPKAQGSWDMPRLTELLRELDKRDNVDLTIVGFDQEDLERMQVWDADEESGGGDGSDPVEPDERFAIIVECNDENHQAELLEKFMKESLKCRAVTA